MNTNTIKQTNIKIVKNKEIFENTKAIASNESYGKTVIIPHVCNNVNSFGGGFAACVASAYPEVKANFHLLGNKVRLGQTQFVTVDIGSKDKNHIIFANMIAQNKTISSSNKRPLNYAALVYSMTEVRSYIKNWEKNSDQKKIEIHAPKFGSGLAGGNWQFIYDLISDIWFDIPVFIYWNK